MIYTPKITITGIPLELLLRVITVSLETNMIGANLPALDIDFSAKTIPSSLPNR